MISSRMTATQEWRVKLNDTPEYSGSFDSLGDALKYCHDHDVLQRIETRTVMVFNVEESWHPRR